LPSVQRLHPVDPGAACGPTKDLFDRVQQRFGRIPNAMKVLANSPPAFAAWWAFDEAMAGSSLPPSVHEQIAVLMANLNGCAYCLSAHTAAARAVGVSSADAAQARHGAASDEQAAAALAFARDAVAARGGVSDAALDRARSAGLTDAELIEILATVAINTFNNYYNRLAAPVIDFPAVALADALPSRAPSAPRNG
jgi:uncharacterized peroxidase-related enzyme